VSPNVLIMRGAMAIADDRGEVAALVLLVAAMAAMIGLALAARWALVRGRKLLTVDGARALEQDRRPPVVFLRSFADDETRYRPRFWRSRLKRHPSFGAWLLGGYRTYEERLAHALRALAPVVTVGDPRERLPVLGADRLYLGDEQWQERVAGLLRRAQLVVLQVADTPSLVWEARQAVRTVEPHRLLLSIPVDTRQGEGPLFRRYEAFRRATTHVFPLPLPPPDALGDAQFLWFSPDWRPHPFVPAIDSAPRHSALWWLRREFRPYPRLRWFRVVCGGAGVAFGVLALVTWWALTREPSSPGHITSTASAQVTPVWRDVAFPDGAAVARMPAEARREPFEQETAVGHAAGVTLEARHNGELYWLMRLTMPPTILAAEPRHVLRNSVKGAIANVGLDLTSTSRRGTRLRPGLAFAAIGADASRVARGIAYLRGRRLYYAVAITDNYAGALARADHFLRSFHLVQ
jgi:hypothetical protein